MAPKTSTSSSTETYSAPNAATSDNPPRSESNAPSISVLFVCLGNICRSPMAEAVFAHITSHLDPSQAIITTDSAGTGAYHTGSPPDSRTMATLRSHGITKYRHAARQVRGSDFEKFDYVLAMDGMNLRDLRRKAKQRQGGTGGTGAGAGGSGAEAETEKGRVSLFGSWDGSGQAGNGVDGEEIDDPYYGGDDGFEVAYQQCVRFSKGWLNTVLGLDVEVDRNGKVTVVELDEQI